MSTEFDTSPIYYVVGGMVYKRPVRNGNSVTMGFPVCAAHEWIGEEGAAVIAQILNSHDMLMEALKELCIAALDTIRPGYPQPHHKLLGMPIEKARAALAFAEGGDL